MIARGDWIQDLCACENDNGCDLLLVCSETNVKHQLLCQPNVCTQAHTLALPVELLVGVIQLLITTDLPPAPNAILADVPGATIVAQQQHRNAACPELPLRGYQLPDVLLVKAALEASCLTGCHPDVAH